MLVGYFSYDTIRYMENLPDNSTDDLLIPDVRLMRPKNLIIYDNLKKKIHFIENVFSDRKINNFIEEFDNINKRLNYFLNCGEISLPKQLTTKKTIIKLNQTHQKKNLKKW